MTNTLTISLSVVELDDVLVIFPDQVARRHVDAVLRQYRQVVQL